MPETFSSPEAVMRYALELAGRGEGRVEPNPQVGAVVVDAELRLLGAGWHEQFGGPHAEVNALREAGVHARGASLFVTLEPCNHQGKTPPCTEAVIKAGIARVNVGCLDPAPHTQWSGVARLRDAGITVDVGLLGTDAETLIRPFTKLMTTGRPYIHAKWAMTLDGKLASKTGSSQWISNPDSRAIVHALRGRMDGILIGRGTQQADDPLLTARPAGSRTPARIVLDRFCQLELTSRLVTTVDSAPLLLVCSADAPPSRRDELALRGVEILVAPCDPAGQLDCRWLLDELGRRRMTNLLIEGGAAVFGSFFDSGLVDEVHAFVGPKIIGGKSAPGPVAGSGQPDMAQALRIQQLTCTPVNGDVYLHGLISAPGDRERNVT